MVSDFLTLFATVDPIGTLALFVGLTGGMDPSQRRRAAFRCIAYATGVLFAFLLLGQLLLEAVGVRLAAFELAGGLIFFLFGVQMIFSSGSSDPGSSVEDGHDPSVFPLAVPSIASPGSILSVVVLTDNNTFEVAQQAQTAAMMFSVLGITLVLLLLANPIFRLIGKSGADLVTRVFGLILAAIAVEMVLEAIGMLLEGFRAAQ